MKIYNKPELKERRMLLRKNETNAEKRLWSYLRKKQFHNLKFYRQYSIDYYIADFYCPSLKLLIEVDGSQHLTEYSVDYDNVRTELLISLGLKVLRFKNEAILNKLREVLDELEKFIQTHPNPLFYEREGQTVDKVLRKWDFVFYITPNILFDNILCQHKLTTIKRG